MSLLLWAQAVMKAAAAAVSGATSFTINVTLDRTFSGDTPAAGPRSPSPGTFNPWTFTYQGDSWELWQAIPFLGTAVSSSVGYCRIQLRNRAVLRNAMQLTDMPDRVVLSNADWAELPWEFTRPSSGLGSPGGEPNARRSLDYIPTRTPGAAASAEGIAQGETFDITLHWD